MNFYVIRGNVSPYMPENFVDNVEKYFSENPDEGYLPKKRRESPLL